MDNSTLPFSFKIEALGTEILLTVPLRGTVGGTGICHLVWVPTDRHPDGSKIESGEGGEGMSKLTSFGILYSPVSIVVLSEALVDELAELAKVPVSAGRGRANARSIEVSPSAWTSACTAWTVWTGVEALRVISGVRASQARLEALSSPVEP